MVFKTSNRPEAQSILDSIRMIVRATRLSTRATERDLGISSAQLYVLQKLGQTAGLSLGELASLTLTHQSSVSVVVTKLCDQGYAQKKPAHDDERRLEITITAKGRELMTTAPEPLQDRLIAAIETLPATRQHWLATSLQQLVEAAGISVEPAPMLFEEK